MSCHIWGVPVMLEHKKCAMQKKYAIKNHAKVSIMLHMTGVPKCPVHAVMHFLYAKLTFWLIFFHTLIHNIFSYFRGFKYGLLSKMWS